MSLDCPPPSFHPRYDNCPMPPIPSSKKCYILYVMLCYMCNSDTYHIMRSIMGYNYVPDLFLTN